MTSLVMTRNGAEIQTPLKICALLHNSCDCTLIVFDHDYVLLKSLNSVKGK